jgi:hypothetical protein
MPADDAEFPVGQAAADDDTQFRLGRRLEPESSLMIFVKKRAKSTWVGYVDVTTLAPVTSLQNRGVRILNLVVNPTCKRL